MTVAGPRRGPSGGMPLRLGTACPAFSCSTSGRRLDVRAKRPAVRRGRPSRLLSAFGLLEDEDDAPPARRGDTSIAATGYGFGVANESAHALKPG